MLAARLGLVVLTLCAAGVGHLRAAACHVGMVCAQRRFIGRDGPFEQRLSLGKLALLRIKPPQGLEARSDVRMVRTERLLADCEGPFEQRLGVS